MEKIKALLLLAIISLAAVPNMVTSLGQESGYVYIKVVDADSKKPLPRINIEIEREGFSTYSSTNSSGFSRFWLSSEEFGVYTVNAWDALGQELTLNVTTIKITGLNNVFVLEAADSRFVKITVIDSLTGSAPPAVALLSEGEMPYITSWPPSLNGSINIVLREGACSVCVGSPLRKAATIDVPSTGDFEKAISMEPTVSLNISLTNNSKVKVSISWSDVEYFDRYAEVYRDYGPPHRTLIQYAVDLTLVKENSYSRKNVRLGTLAFERMSGKKTWTYAVKEEWLNSTAICSISIDRDWLEKLSSSPYGYSYTWGFWGMSAPSFMDAVSPLYAQRMLEKYVEIESEYDLLQANYTSLQRDYRVLKSEFSELTANYTSLKENFQGLQANYTSLQESYENLKGRTYVFTITSATFVVTTVIFIATTIYFARKK